MLIGSLFALEPSTSGQAVVVWSLKATSRVGGLRPVVPGAPQTVTEGKLTVLSFNGKDDALILPVNPLEACKRFTVEILFKPMAGGPLAPRLVHGENNEGVRFTIEARITPKGLWYLGTFSKAGKTGKGLTLVDSAKVHPCGKWYRASLVYNGATMTPYVNAVKEATGAVSFGPMAAGQTAVAARLNRINWFRG